MSCVKGQPCEEGLKRRTALAVLALMAGIFIALSVASFVGSRKQVVPADISYKGHDPVAGKRVFQAYNCMGCHTIVGNGAYFAPDLTNIYSVAGPAWLETFLPSAGQWPKSAAMRVHLNDPTIAVDAGAETIDAYLEKFPGAAERLERRGGQATAMPNLPLSSDETANLIAFLKYTAAMNNEGWPPRPKVDGLNFPEATPMPMAAMGAAPMRVSDVASGAQTAPDPATIGAALAEDNGCTACHAPGRESLVGPGWGGLYDSEAKLADGTSVTADDAYLAESILEPDASIVAGYEPGIMPSFKDVLSDDETAAIVAYIKSLRGDIQ